MNGFFSQKMNLILQNLRSKFNICWCGSACEMRSLLVTMVECDSIQQVEYFSIYSWTLVPFLDFFENENDGMAWRSSNTIHNLRMRRGRQLHSRPPTLAKHQSNYSSDCELGNEIWWPLKLILYWRFTNTHDRAKPSEQHTTHNSKMFANSCAVRVQIADHRSKHERTNVQNTILKTTKQARPIRSGLHQTKNHQFDNNNWMLKLINDDGMVYSYTVYSVHIGILYYTILYTTYTV